MGVLDQIKQMKREGISEDEIKTKLQEQGIAPKAIMDALNQEKIKNAVSSEEGDLTVPTPTPRGDSQFYTPRTQESEESEYYNPQEEYPQEEMPYPGQYGQEEYYPQTSENFTPATAYDTDTQIEIAEQVFAEKIKKFQKQIESLNEFASLAETKISSNHERLKRIESMIDKLQISILDKIGDYGKNINGIKNEMQMMQDSFSKMIPELKEKHHKK